jgi:ABC-type polysaccharide/polyol phosphate export permease
MLMSQQCVDLIFDPSGRLMVSGFVATRLFSTGVPSMMNIAVAPESMIACDNFCRLSCPGAPKRARAVAAIVSRGPGWLWLTLLRLHWDVTALVVLNAMIVILSLSTSICVLYI